MNSHVNTPSPRTIAALVFMVVPTTAYANPSTGAEAALLPIALIQIVLTFFIVRACGGIHLVAAQQSIARSLVVQFGILVIVVSAPAVGMFLLLLYCLMLGGRLIDRAIEKGILHKEQPELAGVRARSLLLGGLTILFFLPASIALLAVAVRR